MRDPKRIKRILRKLERIWTKYPDLRLGQLRDNIIWQNDIFYIEDKDLEEQLDSWIKTNNIK